MGKRKTWAEKKNPPKSRETESKGLKGAGQREERTWGKAATQRERDREQAAEKHADGKQAVQRANKQAKEMDEDKTATDRLREDGEGWQMQRSAKAAGDAERGDTTQRAYCSPQLPLWVPPGGFHGSEASRSLSPPASSSVKIRRLSCHPTKIIHRGASATMIDGCPQPVYFIAVFHNN